MSAGHAVSRVFRVSAMRNIGTGATTYLKIAIIHRQLHDAIPISRTASVQRRSIDKTF